MVFHHPDQYGKWYRLATPEDERVFAEAEAALELTFIRRIATDFLVRHLLQDASSEAIGKEAQFYLTYR